MSVRFNANTDKLSAAHALTIGTGDFSFGIWVKIVTDLDDYSTFFGAATEPTASGKGLLLQTGADGVTADFASLTVLDNYGDALTVGTWYWLVGGRTGTDQKLRIFDDSTSTTPLGTWTITDSTDYSGANALDNLIFGANYGGAYGCDAELANAKIHTGVYWTDAQARAESQNYGIQTAGGTDRLCWKLISTAASTNGLYEIGGAGPDLTNSGVIDGASAPTQLPTDSFALASLYRWNGSAWVAPGILKRWSGSAWVPHTMKIYQP